MGFTADVCAMVVATGILHHQRNASPFREKSGGEPRRKEWLEENGEEGEGGGRELG